MNVVFSIPSLISYLRILLTPIFVLCLVLGGPYLFWAFVVFTIASATDYYDGYFARKLGLVSKFGAFLDPLADKVLVLTTFYFFYSYNIIDFWMVVLIVFRDLMVTGLRVFFMKRGAVLVTSQVGKWKTFAQFILIYAILGTVGYYAYHGVKSIDEVSILLSSVTIINILIRAVVWLTLYSGLHYLARNRRVILKFVRGQ